MSAKSKTSSPAPKAAAKMTWKWRVHSTDKNLWLTEKPDVSIKRLSKNSDGSYTFMIYRGGRYIDCTNDLEEAKVVAEKGVMRPERILAIEVIRKYIKETPKNADAYAKLTKIQQQTIVDSYPWLVPSKAALEGKKGVKVTSVNSVRTDLKSKNEQKAEGLPLDALIKLAKGGKNPKKEGSDAWSRWQLLFQHEGKTVGVFIAAHGNPTTLRNAVKSGHVAVEGM
jgi:hypothetical protein